MFDVEIWGTVADWAAAFGTGGAAITAAWYYIHESARTKSAQARLISVSIKNTLFAIEPFAIEVTNNSGHQISNMFIRYRQKSLWRSLLKDDHHVVFRECKEPWLEKAKYIRLLESSERVVELYRKSDLLRGRMLAGLIIMQPNKLAAGKTVTYAEELTDHQDPTNYRYWIWFQDADGNLWEREAVDYAGAGRLRKMRRMSTSAVHSSARRHRFRKLPHYWRAMLWLINNRNQSPLEPPAIHYPNGSENGD